MQLVPVLELIAPELEGTLAIGKVDCTTQKSFCHEFKVKGYPTLKFVVDGEVIDYRGGRDQKSLTAFAKKLSGPIVYNVDNYEQALTFASEETKDGVAFLGYDPKSTPENPSEIYKQFQQVAREYRASAFFLWLNNGEDHRDYPFIHKIQKDVRPSSYQSNDVDIANMTPELLSEWVKSYNYPLVVEFDARNLARIGKNGRKLAIAVVDYGEPEQRAAIVEHIYTYVKTLKDEVMDQYYFGTIDGARWPHFLEQFSIVEQENPQLFVVDMPTKNYWQNSSYPNFGQLMQAIENGDIAPRVAKRPTGKGALGMIEYVFVETYPFSMIFCLFAVFGGIFYMLPYAEPPEGQEGANAAGGKVPKTVTTPAETKKNK